MTRRSSPPSTTVVGDSVALKGHVDDYNVAQAAFKKARTALAAGTAEWDRSYRILIAAAEKHCATADAGTALGLSVLGKTKYPFAKPIAVEVTQNLDKGMLPIRVARPASVRSVCVEVSPDPVTPASSVELPGHGAIHEIPLPAPWHHLSPRREPERQDQ